MINFNILFKNFNFFLKLFLKRNFKINFIILKKKESYLKLLRFKLNKFYEKKNFYSKLIIIYKDDFKYFNIFTFKIFKLTKILNKIKKIVFLLQNNIKYYLLSIPNILSNDVLKDNREIFRWGQISCFNFLIKNHIEIGQFKKELDFSSGVKLTGTKFVVMSGQIAKLHRALIQFMLDIHIMNHGYKEYYVPYIVNQTSLYGTGQLPKFIDDLFYVNLMNKNNKINNYALIPTAEVPLVNLMRDNIINESLLPLKMVSHTPCFRSESNSYGLDNRGLFRLHQFDKVEIVQFVKPEYSFSALEEITNHSENILKLLNLPYRKILLCSKDISFSSCKTYDLEVWFPSMNNFKEVSSCSNTGDFQSRRMNIKYRRKIDNKLVLVNILNASGLAVSRTLMAILENNQLSDGRIKIPVVLKSYMRGLDYIY